MRPRWPLSAQKMKDKHQGEAFRWRGKEVFISGKSRGGTLEGDSALQEKHLFRSLRVINRQGPLPVCDCLLCSDPWSVLTTTALGEVRQLTSAFFCSLLQKANHRQAIFPLGSEVKSKYNKIPITAPTLQSLSPVSPAQLAATEKQCSPTASSFC